MLMNSLDFTGAEAELLFSLSFEANWRCTAASYMFAFAADSYLRINASARACRSSASLP